ncbi:MAG: L,D-transpeptidase family protein [Verrucomicrobiota bacterium]
MYWYYKVPLLILLALCLFGCGMLIWNRLPNNIRSTITPNGNAEESAAGEDDRSHADAGEPANQRDSKKKRSAPIPQVVLKRLRAARTQLDGNNLESARSLAQKVLSNEDVEPFSQPWRKAADIVSEVNTKLINSDIPCEEKAVYRIKKGDSLARIAKQFNTTIGALQRSNNLDPNSARIYPGETLHIYQADWNILVVKEAFALLLRDGDEVFKLYETGIGRQNRTPTGTFKVTSKQKEPAWTPPGKIIPYGDPENVLGTRWLGLTPTDETDPNLRGYGIHGTWEPETVGTAASEGCVRMRNEEVNELFDLVPMGTAVRIRNEHNDEE